MIEELFVDLDETLFDWRSNAHARYPSYKSMVELNQDDEFRNWVQHEINNHPDMFSNLDLLPYADRLIDLLRGYSNAGVPVHILSASGASTDSAHDMVSSYKSNDCVRHGLDFCESIIIVKRSSDKVKMSRPRRCLIDDFHINCKSWIERGGRAIHALHPLVTISELERVLGVIDPSNPSILNRRY